VLRKDNSWSYSFAGVIDDAFQKITHITRGNDLKPTLKRNRIIQGSLGLHYPKVIHVPLVIDENGNKLSKAKGSQALRNGIHIDKQLRLAWDHLKQNMPLNWLERVSKFTESYFF
jgi:glutamyl-Q tRNA(Asp) synthetase